jgi:hypothetical protein
MELPNNYRSWEGSLSRETQKFLVGDRSARRLWLEMDPGVRRLLTHCSPLCVPKRVSKRNVETIKNLKSRLGIPDDHPELREFLFKNRRRLTNALDEIKSVRTIKGLERRLQGFIRKRASDLGGSAVMRRDGRWEFFHRDGHSVMEYTVTPYGSKPKTGNFFQSHHGIQDAWAKQWFPPYYKSGDCPAIMLRDSRAGTPHQIVTNRQYGRASKISKRTYYGERKMMIADLKAAGVPRKYINKLLRDSDKYFGKIYKQMRADGYSVHELRVYFGRWKPS